MKLNVQFEIFRISEDGLLKVPTNTWGERVFYHKYDTLEEALEDIKRLGGPYNEYTILPIYRMIESD